MYISFDFKLIAKYVYMNMAADTSMYINYGIEVYGASVKKYIKAIEVLQYKVLKVLFNLDPLTSSSTACSIFWQVAAQPASQGGVAYKRILGRQASPV